MATARCISCSRFVKCGATHCARHATAQSATVADLWAPGQGWRCLSIDDRALAHKVVLTADALNAQAAIEVEVDSRPCAAADEPVFDGTVPVPTWTPVRLLGAAMCLAPVLAVLLIVLRSL